MPQLNFEPAATQLGENQWVITPKNNSDTIIAKGQLKTGTYKIAIKCDTLTKDIILAMYGSPTLNNDGQLVGNTTKADIIARLLPIYTELWEPDESGKYEATFDEETEPTVFDTLEEALLAWINYVKQWLLRGASNNDDVDSGVTDSSN